VADRESPPPGSRTREEHSENPLVTEFITLARVAKTQGRHGEVAVEVHSDVPDRLRIGMRLFALLRFQNAAEEQGQQQLEVESLWPHKGLLVVKFSGIDSMSDAETLIGAELQVPRAERAQLEPGSNYVSDLVDCLVFDRDREIGRIADLQFGAGEAPLLVVVDRRGTKYEVPFAEAYLEGINVRQKQVRMNLPAGMLEINGPMTDEEKQEQNSRQKSPKRSRSRFPG
jgi:16S rRNA processing protein RimM